MDKKNLSMVNLPASHESINQKIDTITAQPGSSDLVDPDEGQQALGWLVLQEINKETKEALFEATVTSGYFKNEESCEPFQRRSSSQWQTFH